MSLTGRIVGADEALAMGLILDVVPVDALGGRVGQLVDELLKGAPLPQAINKQMLNASSGSSMADMVAWEGEAQSVMLGTADAAEGIMSFLEKRDPHWSGS